MVISTDFEVKLGTDSRPRRRQQHAQLRCLVFAELSDQPHDSEQFFAHRVDIGRFDELIRKLAPSFIDPDSIDSGESEPYPLLAIEDFHPDSLIGRVTSLRELTELRSQLKNPAATESAAARIRELAGVAPEAGRTDQPDETSDAAPEQQDAMLERLLGSSARGESPSRAKQTVDALIQQALGASQQTSTAPQTGDAEQLLDELANRRLRAILTDPGFQSRERAWRSLEWLVSHVEEEQAEIFVLDVSKEALAGHLSQYSDRLDQSPLHQILVADDAGWDLLIGDFAFGLNVEDMAMLAGIGAVAARARAPFLGQAELSLAGCPGPDSIEQAWDWKIPDDELGAFWRQLRQHPAATWISLAIPRFVLRFPYGRKNDPIEGFAFEELPARPDSRRFLWANPAFACALLMIESHAGGELEWPRRLGGDVTDLPTPLYDDGTGEAMQPPLEWLFDERARSTATGLGLTVFASGRNTNRIATAVVSPLSVSGQTTGTQSIS